MSNQLDQIFMKISPETYFWTKRTDYILEVIGFSIIKILKLKNFNINSAFLDDGLQRDALCEGRMLFVFSPVLFQSLYPALRSNSCIFKLMYTPAIYSLIYLLELMVHVRR